MNKSVQKLFDIANKKKRNILGLMSGTSLDGLDVAYCTIEGSGNESKIVLNNFQTFPYSESTKKIIRKVFAKHDGQLKDVCQLNTWLAVEHAKIINEVLKTWNVSKETIDLIASHGQTIYHAPAEQFDDNTINSTLQICDGDQLAQLTGIITLSDFRQKHIAAGGEGAPLALYGDYILFGNSDRDTLLLNIGGISNFTFLPADNKRIICSDIGPGNTLMDAWMFDKYQLPMDVDGNKAEQGIIQEVLLKAFMDHPFLKKSFPKTCGQEIFNLSFIEENLKENHSVSPENVIATLNKFTADSIINAINKITSRKFDLYISGGGVHNSILMNHLKHGLPLASFCNIDDKGINADAKEAVLFAILANETIAGDVSIFADAGISPAVSFGKISLPD